MVILLTFILFSKFSTLVAYYNPEYTLTHDSEAIFGNACGIIRQAGRTTTAMSDVVHQEKTKEIDPFDHLEEVLYALLFGPKPPGHTDETELLLDHSGPRDEKLRSIIAPDDELAHCPSGSILHAELVAGKPGVHIPMFEYMFVGHSYLNVTDDAMQTAVDAFGIFIRGSVRDVLRLPPEYVLNSARTIAMMRIPHEKLNATWEVVKRGRRTVQVEHWELEMYRPLFKYVNGRDMARLDLTKPAILAYIGTHADLNRHQVGVVASRYIRINTNWSQPEYLNMMNNLLCGVPMSLMRKIDSQVYLLLNHQVFYHIRACDALQRRFYLAIMTRTDALGKSYSWSARDVARFGLLLAELEGPELASIAPEAMSGLTAQVMLEMPAVTLQYITDEQVKYLGLKSLTILTRKLTQYRSQQRSPNQAKRQSNSMIVVLLIQCFVHEINRYSYNLKNY